MDITAQANNQQLTALARCGHSDMKALIELCEALLADTQEALIAADAPVRIHRLQGRAEFLRDFLEAVQAAPMVLERLRN